MEHACGIKSVKTNQGIVLNLNITCVAAMVMFKFHFLPQPPPLLQHLMFDHSATESKKIQDNIRLYNSMFAFSSPGFKVDKGIKAGIGPPTIRIQG